MNYLAHGYRHCDHPYRLAGTALPDWVSACNRRVKLKPEHIDRLCAARHPRVRELGDGARQHLLEDDGFHRNKRFLSLVNRVAAGVRGAARGAPGVRAGFIAHVLVEMLLDRALMERDGTLVARYYESLAQVDPERVEAVVARSTGRSLPLAQWIERFRRARFLDDYHDDSLVRKRLSQVLARVGLPPLPTRLDTFLPEAHAWVKPHATELLAWNQAPP